MTENKHEKPPQGAVPDPDERSEEDKGYSDNPEGQGLSTTMWVVLGMGLACSLCSAITFALFLLRTTTQVTKGRPFWRWGQAQSPVAVVSGCESSVPCTALEERTAQALGEAWLADGEAEHASIAAFADLQLRLLALGAPSSLLSQTAKAIQDEIHHAEFCYTQASSYTENRFQPGAMKVNGARSGGFGPRSLRLGFLALESLFDGCLNEGVAARMARRASERCKPSLSGALRKIAEDEEAHAQLAWNIVEWAVSDGGPLTQSLLKRALKRLKTMQGPRQEEPTEIAMDLWLLEGQTLASDSREAFYEQQLELIERLTVLLQARVRVASAA